ncbi:MAG: hypothetical protein AMS16_00575 [Planctomycetes bacterium DG_58]|nr:MAG: hypothetical protein AMS16_00575 [Planctomycetes bacterium DG_58]
MGWATRAGGLFYYRKRRIGRRVVSKYGGGEVAEIIAALDAQEQAERTWASARHICAWPRRPTAAW